MNIDATALEEILDSCSDLLTEGQEEALKAAIAAAHPSQGVVDEAMVERACAAFMEASPRVKAIAHGSMRAALQAAALPASNNADTLSQALHGLHTVLYSGDWHMPDDTHAQLEGIYEDAKNGLGTGFIDAALPAVPEDWREDVSLAAQMLTWGRDEGLDEKQIKEIDAHAERLFAMLAAQPVVPSVPKDGDTFAAISAEMREVVNGYDFDRDHDLSEWAKRIDALAALPAVPDAVLVLMNHIENVLPDEAFNLIDFNLWNAVTNLHLAATLAHDQPEGSDNG